MSFANDNGFSPNIVANVFAGNFNLGQMRFSTGLSAKWLSPFGALTFSIAEPLNAKTQCYGVNTPSYNPPTSGCASGEPVADQVQRFQFSFGQGF